MPVEEQIKPTLKKKKKKKQPNPLSCKKKKKKTNSESMPTRPAIDSIQNKSIEKQKRKRVKISSHIKEMLQTN